MGLDLLSRAARWIKRRQEERLLNQFGGIQTCPWCRQCAQSEPDWRFRPWDRDPFLDVLTCGVCGGTSLWKFEIGMFYIGPLTAPEPKWPPVPHYDIEAATLRGGSAK